MRGPAMTTSNHLWAIGFDDVERADQVRNEIARLGTTVGFLAGLVLSAPLTGAIVGAALGSVGTAVTAQAGIGEEFVRDVEDLLEPGTSALFVLDAEGDMELILHRIHGLGGTVVRTNVDPERAKLIQSMLAATSANTSEPDTK
jgi:uncharacterized membrane protein